MSLEDKLYALFERTLNTNDHEQLQKIIQNQAKVIQSKSNANPNPPAQKENAGPVLVSSIQKKLQAIEKNFMCQESTKKRRHSRYEHRSKTNSIYESSHRRTPTQPNQEELLFECNEISEFFEDSETVKELRRENAKLKERLRELEIAERENYL